MEQTGNQQQSLPSCDSGPAKGTGRAGGCGRPVHRQLQKVQPASQRCSHTPICTSKVTLSRKCHHPILAAAQTKMLDCGQFSFEFFNILIHSCALMYERKKTPLSLQHMGGHIF